MALLEALWQKKSTGSRGPWPIGSAEARRGVSTPAARAECGVVNLRCVSGTSCGAWVGVVQAPAGCGEGC